MDSEPIDRHREALLDAYGISPAVARAWIEGTFEVTPEEIRRANPDGHGSHEIEVFTRIALGEEDAYLLEEVYEAYYRELKRSGRDWTKGISVFTMCEMRQDEWRLGSRDLKKKYASAP